MAEQVRISNSPPTFRVAKPGKSITSTDQNDFYIHDEMQPFQPRYSGSVFVGQNSSVDVTTIEFVYPPFILFRSSLNIAPVLRKGQGNLAGMTESYYARFIPPTTLRIFNRSTSDMTITYFIYYNELLE